MTTSLLALLYLVLGLFTWYELLDRQLPREVRPKPERKGRLHSLHTAFAGYAHPVTYVAIAALTYLFAFHD